MASGAWAHVIQGDCLNMAEPCIPYRTFTIHASVGPSFGPQPFYTGAGFTTCGRVFPEDDYGTGQINSINRDYTSFQQGPKYGRQPEASDPTPVPVTLRSFTTGDPVYFLSTDLDYWAGRGHWIPSPTSGMRFNVTGPPVKWAHIATPVRRRLKGAVNYNNKAYDNRYNFYFTDADEPIYGQTDWLGQLHPGSYFWTNTGLNEPFKAVDFYEQTLTNPNPESNRMWTLPFCQPMTVRNISGQSIGQYTGYTVIHYFSFAFVHFGDAVVKVVNPETLQEVSTRPFLPCDYREEVPAEGDCKKIKTAYQLWSLDSHWFMIGTNGIGSPKLGSFRTWFYHDTAKSPNVCNPYMYCMMGTPNNLPASIWRFNVEFNQTNSTTRNIQFGLTGLGMYITP